MGSNLSCRNVSIDSIQTNAEGIAADYDQEGRLAGIEILDALKRFGDPNILRRIVLEDID